MNGPIFIIGPHRSGSTLWHNLVATRPGLLRLPETRFMGAPRQRDFRFFLQTQARDLSTDAAIESMVELCFSRKSVPGLEGAFWRFENIAAADNPEMKKEVARRIKASDRSIGAIAAIIIEELVRFSGKTRACVKFPLEACYIPELISWFPNCRIMHITRDPRAMAMSKSNDPSGTAIRVWEHPRLAPFIRKFMVLFVIAQYKESARLHRRFEPLPNYRLFRYEDLLANPEKTLREVCSFIECDFTPDMLEPEKGQHEHQPSSITGKKQKEFDPKAAVRWQSVIPASDRWLITTMTSSSMRMMGYDPDTHPIFKQGAPAR
ncbi:MAG TPA: sulfotransferase [Verrucomicrobiae bacterium]|nr:sulfotransferase [Verrucomicrobiae bacterium]